MLNKRCFNRAKKNLSDAEILRVRIEFRIRLAIIILLGCVITILAAGAIIVSITQPERAIDVWQSLAPKISGLVSVAVITALTSNTRQQSASGGN